MNHPSIRPTLRRNGASDPGEEDGMLEAIARHVSAEGCQFILSSKGPGVGRRLSLTIGSLPRICGRISWVLDDRIGVAFDRKIDPHTVTILAAQSTLLKTVRLNVLNDPR